MTIYLAVIFSWLSFACQIAAICVCLVMWYRVRERVWLLFVPKAAETLLQGGLESLMDIKTVLRQDEMHAIDKQVEALTLFSCGSGFVALVANVCLVVALYVLLRRGRPGVTSREGSGG